MNVLLTFYKHFETSLALYRDTTVMIILLKFETTVIIFVRKPWTIELEINCALFIYHWILFEWHSYHIHAHVLVTSINETLNCQSRTQAQAMNSTQIDVIVRAIHDTPHPWPLFPSLRGFLEKEETIIILRVCRVSRTMRSNGWLLLKNSPRKNAFYVTRPSCSHKHFIFRPFLFLIAAPTFSLGRLLL